MKDFVYSELIRLYRSDESIDIEEAKMNSNLYGLRE